MNHEFYDREDGLAHCKVCNGAEGSLATHCPGAKLPAETQDAVYAGIIDYVDGSWVPGAHQRKTALGIANCMLSLPATMLQDSVLLEFLAEAEHPELKAEYVTVVYRDKSCSQSGPSHRLSDGRYVQVWSNDRVPGPVESAWVAVSRSK